MGCYTDIIQEIYTRLNTATGEGKKLSNIKSVKVGVRSVVEDNYILPSILIDIEQIGENYNGTGQNLKRGQILLNILVVDKISNKDATNIIYTTGTPETGFLALIETIMDVISEDTSQNIDPQLNQNSLSSIDLQVTNFQKINNNQISCEIMVLATARDFEINERI